MSTTTKLVPVTAKLRGAARSVWAASPERVLGVAASLLMFASYGVVFLLTGTANPSGAVIRALVNTLPAAALAVPIYIGVRRYLTGQSVRRQVLGHLGLSLFFALAWYLGIQILYGLRSGWLTEGLRPISLSGIAFTWQMFQGVTVYAAVAAYAYAITYWELAERMRSERDEARAAVRAARTRSGPTQTSKPARLLLRQDREFVPVDTRDIVRISGAGDKTEVVTRSTRISTATTMAELEDALPDGFLRVHRSHLIALGAVLHAEPAGNGRLTLHLIGGDSVTASRAGTRAFRDSAL